jgi:hypothetical protein
MRNTTCHTREHRTITVDVHNQATSLQFIGDGKTLIACVVAFLLALGVQRTHNASCRSGGCLTRHSHSLRVRRCARSSAISLRWLVEVAEHRAAFSPYFLHDVRVTQVQLDVFFALPSAVQTDEVSQAEAMKRFDCSSQWVFVAMDPISTLLLTIDVGDRTLAMAQHLVPQVAQV